MKQSFYLLGCMCIVLLAGACRTPGIQPQKNQNMDSQIIVTTTSPKGGAISVSSPPVYIYKTREDYSHLVPVIMNDARTTIVSYPHPRDLRIGDKLCLPTLLEKAIGWTIGGLAGMLSFFPIRTRSIVNWVVHPLWRN